MIFPPGQAGFAAARFRIPPAGKFLIAKIAAQKTVCRSNCDNFFRDSQK
jgi:hypothetical protein